jgi:hypothetical protein
MTTYDRKAIQERLNDLQRRQAGGKSSGSRSGAKLKWFKPQLGPNNEPRTYEIRFVPIPGRTDSGEPFEEVSFYDNKELNDWRFAAPAQFEMEDPINELLVELVKDPKNNRELIKALRPFSKYFAPVLVRGEESEGVQVWELKQKDLFEIYKHLAHPDAAEEDMFSPEGGTDFMLTVTDSGKTFNQYVVKAVTVLPRRKSSPLAATKAARDKILKTVPDIREYFKGTVRSADWIKQKLENYMAKSSEETTPEQTVSGRSPGVSKEQQQNAAMKQLESVFGDLDTEEDDENQKTLF